MTDALILRREDAVLVMIDLQDRLLAHIHQADRVVENAVRLARFARIVGLPVVWAEQEKLGETAAPVRAALEGLAPVRKLHFGCLGCGELAAQIEAVGRRTLVLLGVEAHVCVAQTALQALPRFGVQVVADAVSSRVPENREVALARLARAGAVVTSTEMLIYELLGRAGTEEFKAVLPLVK